MYPDSLATVVLGSLAAPTDADTTPAAIFARQCDEVKRYFAAIPDATVEEAAHDLILPVVSVRRALKHLGIEKGGGA